MKIPEMQSRCSFRLEGISGGRAVLFVCGDVKNAHYHEIVYQSTCDECGQNRPGEHAPETLQKPHRSGVEITPQGTLIYQRGGWEVPPIPPGYRARSSDPDNDDAWILDPVDAVCKHLELVPAEVGSCGYQRIARRCKLIDSFIGAKTCGTCGRK